MIYLVVSKRVGFLMDKIHMAFRDRVLAEACLKNLEGNPVTHTVFKVYFEILEVEVVDWGSPKANKLMIG